MTPKLLRELKEVQFSCTSPTPASINSTSFIDHQSSMLMSAGMGGRAIDRCSPHLRDPLRAKSLNPVLLSQPKPKSFNSSSKSKKTSSDKKPVELNVSPASSQRYLLGDDSNSEEFSDITEPAAPHSSITLNKPSRFQSSKVEELTIVRPFEASSWIQSVKDEDANLTRPSSSSSSASANIRTQEQQQVVVLRVSLHCKGCEGKVRKHISKMEGVTSFTTDLINKKVTVVGNVTPLGVLNSISKVKNAQLWPSQPPAATAAAAVSN